MLVVHTPKRNKKTNPKSMTKTVCVLSLESSQFPLVFSSVSCSSPTGPEGLFPSGEGSWMAVGDQNPCFPLLPLPTALFLTSYSGLPHTNAPRSPSHPSSRGPAGGSQRREGARWPSAAPVGRVAERALPLVPGWGCCLGRGPAGFGVLPSSKDAPKPLSISRCVNMANLFYSFSVHYAQLYIYIYTYISLYIDIYRYTHIYYL